MSEREKPGVAFWATVVVACPVMYAASTGPVSLAYYELGRPHWLYVAELLFYAPLFWVLDNAPDQWCWAFNAYVNCWAPA